VEKIHRLIEIGFEKMKKSHACSRFDVLDSKKKKNKKTKNQRPVRGSRRFL